MCFDLTHGLLGGSSCGQAEHRHGTGKRDQPVRLTRSKQLRYLWANGGVRMAPKGSGLASFRQDRAQNSHGKNEALIGTPYGSKLQLSLSG